MAIGASVLNEEKVSLIRVMLESGYFTHQQIGDTFGCSRELITAIKNGHRWNDDIKSYIMKSSNSFREFNDVPNKPHKDNSIKNITIHYNDGRKVEL
tara:strand:+ start:551 stop:841 length:291 start_codon:yes stop_codon:yes gene_type:complete